MKIVSFNDFQKILNENNGKPIYKKVGNKYKLEWTLGGFLYQTEVSFKQIFDSYKLTTGKKDDKSAIIRFEKMYLEDCYQETTSKELLKQEGIPLFEGMKPVVREEEKFSYYTPVRKLKDMIPNSLFVKSNKGKKTIMGIGKDSNGISTLGVLVFKNNRLMAKEQASKFALRNEKIEAIDPKELEKRIKSIETRVSKKVKSWLKR